VDEKRAAYFADEFTPDCISASTGTDGTPVYRLSLAAANIFLLEKSGVHNILHCTTCTCCSPYTGSFRRETALLPADLPLEEKIRSFTAAAAFISYNMNDGT
jgi:copper oxidase (laccase) domain-containing protein